MYGLVRPALFAMDPERAHEFALQTLAFAGKSPLGQKALHTLWGRKVAEKPIELMGLQLPNPVGVAAGLDKQGIAGDALRAMGFGWVEFGTVTPKPQSGNDKPRMFRLTPEQAIINRMGFNSIGLAAFMDNIAQLSPDLIKGLNIGKNAATPIDRAIDDYLLALEGVYPIADYITLNISSPNTKNLRELQGDESLDALLAAVTHKREQLADQTGLKKPLVLKVAPDLTAPQIDTICDRLMHHQIDGLCATNTTLSRAGVENNLKAGEAGGLSGAPLRELSTECIAAFHKRLQGEIPIIGAGGISDLASAQEKIDAGATAIQLYTGFIYRGPELVREIVNGLRLPVKGGIRLGSL